MGKAYMSRTGRRGAASAEYIWVVGGIVLCGIGLVTILGQRASQKLSDASRRLDGRSATSPQPTPLDLSPSSAPQSADLLAPGKTAGHVPAVAPPQSPLTDPLLAKPGVNPLNPKPGFQMPNFGPVGAGTSLDEVPNSPEYTKAKSSNDAGTMRRAAEQELFKHQKERGKAGKDGNVTYADPKDRETARKWSYEAARQANREAEEHDKKKTTDGKREAGEARAKAADHLREAERQGQDLGKAGEKDPWVKDIVKTYLPGRDPVKPEVTSPAYEEARKTGDTAGMRRAAEQELFKHQKERGKADKDGNITYADPKDRETARKWSYEAARQANREAEEHAEKNTADGKREAGEARTRAADHLREAERQGQDLGKAGEKDPWVKSYTPGNDADRSPLTSPAYEEARKKGDAEGMRRAAEKELSDHQKERGKADKDGNITYADPKDRETARKWSYEAARQANREAEEHDKKNTADGKREAGEARARAADHLREAERQGEDLGKAGEKDPWVKNIAEPASPGRDAGNQQVTSPAYEEARKTGDAAGMRRAAEEEIFDHQKQRGTKDKEGNFTYADPKDRETARKWSYEAARQSMREAEEHDKSNTPEGKSQAEEARRRAGDYLRESERQGQDLGKAGEKDPWVKDAVKGQKPDPNAGKGS